MPQRPRSFSFCRGGVAGKVNKRGDKKGIPFKKKKKEKKLVSTHVERGGG